MHARWKIRVVRMEVVIIDSWPRIVHQTRRGVAEGGRATVMNDGTVSSEVLARCMLGH